MAVVYPAKGQEREVAQQLLKLARYRSGEIRTTSETLEGTGSVAFMVPDDIADRYNAGEGAALAGPEEDASEEVAPRRRGRPRKVTTQETES